ncbi:hypothetical protein [Bacillus sp. AFS037270]|uniref:hypothetical protein n=2 Tax=unclassified Bacillus (in: firmicutes) TaxID=185979 RepID=UPI001C3F46F2|nr:hypothetical protein [Bacillus sp. AFS037270]
MKVAKRWYQKAVDCDDRFDQFISIWISFNAIYGRREGNEFRKIKSIINEFNNETITNILSLDEVQFFCNMELPIKFLNKYQEIEDTSYAQNHLKRNISRNPKFAIEQLLFILNKVRNNLFHGDKRLENMRDVDIVKHAYPIVRTIVKAHLGLDENIEPILEERTSTTINSIERYLLEKIEELQAEIRTYLTNFSTIPKDKNHPVSILLDRINMQANAIHSGFNDPEQLKNIQKRLLQLYEKNKPEVLKDVEEVYDFVHKRMSEVINEGCTKGDVERFYDEYMALQRKYLEKGYVFKT